MLLTLETLESAGFAIRYHELPVRTLADCARARFPFDYYTALSEIHEDTKRAITSDTARNAAGSSGQNAHWIPKGKNKGQGKKNGKPNQNTKNNKAPKGKKGKQGNTATRPTGKGPAPVDNAIAVPAAAGK